MKNPTTLHLTSYFCICFCFLLLSCQQNNSDGKQTVATEVEALAKKIENASQETFDPKEFPLIMRRTTLIVRDIEKSMALYKDAIGMEVIYDNIIKRKHPTEEGDQEIRLVFLKANHSYFGVLGLVDYEYNKKDKVEVPIRKEGFAVQNSVLLFNTNDLDGRFAQIENTPGVEVITAPAIRKYPSYDGESVIEVMVSTFYDPDGFLVEFNQPMSEFNVN